MPLVRVKIVRTAIGFGLTCLLRVLVPAVEPGRFGHAAAIALPAAAFLGATWLVLAGAPRDAVPRAWHGAGRLGHSAAGGARLRVDAAGLERALFRRQMGARSPGGPSGRARGAGARPAGPARGAALSAQPALPVQCLEFDSRAGRRGSRAGQAHDHGALRLPAPPDAWRSTARRGRLETRSRRSETTWRSRRFASRVVCACAWTSTPGCATSRSRASSCIRWSRTRSSTG